MVGASRKSGKKIIFWVTKMEELCLLFGIFVSLKNGNYEGFGGMLLVRLKFGTLDVLEDAVILTKVNLKRRSEFCI